MSSIPVGPYLKDTCMYIIYSGTPPYGHLVIMVSFFQPSKTAIDFLIKKPLLMWPPVYMANGHILKSQTVEFLIIYVRNLEK